MSSASFERLITAFRANSDAYLLLHGLDVPAATSLGVAGTGPEGQVASIREINRRVAERCAAAPGVHLLDYDAVVAGLGRRAWYDERKWAGDADAVPHREHGAARRGVASIHPPDGGASRQGARLRPRQHAVGWRRRRGWGRTASASAPIRVAPGTSCCKRSIRDLIPRGVLLGLCSKNNRTDIDEVFQRHSEMVLRLDHFASYE